MLKQQVLKSENIQSIELSTNGKDECYTNPIVINGLKAGKGIKAVKLDLVADKVPKVIIIGTPPLISDEVNKGWGLVDSEWEDTTDGTVTVNVKIEGVPENTLPLDYLVNNQAEE
ncbi:hypothetical protein [Enterococcus gallinarum]|uniref:hypothetical protein n=1 Tax=Enterococcus gallinarum TaxID=1353 RepID=UPI0010EA2281|nr:hypothetical protein [Enterococcus gallinarum]QGR80762.1 hypothetical protein FOC36_00530 [Enterococcus gallinarum]TXW62207.1 hypothetical protein D4M64_05745 [Enterococcus gallinarum]VTS79147.1 Uncharacterised protein [Enterococcus gallinarum]